MEALLAIAALCSISGGISTDAIEEKQVYCQQQMIKCYFEKSEALSAFDAAAKSPQAGKFLHECALSRKIKTVPAPTNPPYRN